MRTRFTTWDGLKRHLKALKLRHRGLRAFRRAFYSVAEADGADRNILYWGVHAARPTCRASTVRPTGAASAVRSRSYSFSARREHVCSRYVLPRPVRSRHDRPRHV